MKIKWNSKAIAKYFATLDYWDNRNQSYEYSQKIEYAVNQEIKDIKENPYFLAIYSPKLNMYRKIFFNGKFSLFYRIDLETDTIWIMIFRSNKQKPIH